MKIEYVDITAEEFEEKVQGFEARLNGLFAEGNALDKQIMANMITLKMD